MSHKRGVNFASDFSRPDRAVYLLLLACYLLSLGTFQTLGPIGGSERVLREQVQFDWVAAIKAVTRVVAFTLVVSALVRCRAIKSTHLVRWYLLPWGLFGLWAIVTTLWSPFPLYTLGHALEFCLLIMIAALTAILGSNNSNLSVVLRHLCFMHLLCLLLLVYSSMAAPTSAQILRSELQSESVLFAAQPGSTFIINPADTAGVASFGLLLILACRLFWNWRWARLLFFPALLIEGTILFLAQTRSAILITAIMATLCFLYRGRGKLVATAAVLAALTGTTYLTLDSSIEKARLMWESSVGTYLTRGQSREELEGLSGRASNWSQVLGDIPKSPVGGHGYSMATTTGKLWREGRLVRYTAHNLLLNVISGTGIVGVILFLWGLLRLFSANWRRFRLSRDNRLPYLALITLTYLLLWGVLGDSIVAALVPTTVSIFVVIGLGAWPQPEWPKAGPPRKGPGVGETTTSQRSSRPPRISLLKPYNNRLVRRLTAKF